MSMANGSAPDAHTNTLPVPSTDETCSVGIGRIENIEKGNLLLADKY